MGSKFTPSRNYVNGTLTVDGDVVITGSLSASSIIGGGATTPGAPATSVQFNDGGAFAGDAQFTWDKTGNALTVTGDVTASANVSASFFHGDGTGITGITATAAPAGSNTQVQFNADGVTGADTDFTWLTGSNTLSISGDISGSGNVSGSFFYGDGSNLTNTPAGSPAGSNTQVQFNADGAFGSDADLAWASGSNTLTVTGDISGSGTISGSSFHGDGGALTNLPSAAISVYSTPFNDRIITSVNATTVQGEADLTFDGTTLAITGDMSASVNVSGSDFYGGGANLTDLNASSVSAGTLANARLPATISVTNVTASTLVSASLFYGDGSNLTNLPSGAPAGSNTEIQFNADGVHGADPQFTWTSGSNVLTVTGDISGSGAISGSTFYGDGGALTNLPSAAISGYDTPGNDRIITSANATTVQGESNLTFDGTTLAITGDMSASINISGSDFYGGGANLTDLDASSISAGTLTNARLPATISVTNITASTLVSASAYYGDGSNLSNLPAGSPAGSNTQIQFNADGAFGADPQITWASGSNTLTVTGDISGSGTISGSSFHGDGAALTNLPSAAISSYDTPGAGRIITSVNATTVEGEANLTFDNTTLTITGDISGSGNISGSAFYGDGANLTSLDADNISAGTLANARLPATISVTNVSASSLVSASLFYGDGSNLSNLPAGSPVGSDTQIQFNDGGSAFGGDAEFTWNKTSNTLTVTGDISASVNVSGSDFYGGGANLTALDADNISAGTLNNARLPTTVSVTNVSASTLVSASSFYGDASNLTGLPVQNYNNATDNFIITAADSNTVQGEANLTFDGTTLTITGDVSGSGNVSGSAFYGDGANLTALNASNVSAGTLDNARLPATISVTNVTASTLVSASSFYGDGSNLTNLPAGSPVGADTQIQFNDGGSAFGGDAQFTWNKTTNALTVTGDITASANVSGAFFHGDGSGLTGVSATAAPAGSNTQIQFNDDGATAADTDFTWLTGSNTLGVVGGVEITGTFQAGSATEYISFSSIGSETSIQNSTTIKEVTTASDFPQPLATNTSYMVRGDVLLTTPLTASTEGISISGYNRNRDILRYHGTEPMITTTDVNFTISHLGFRTSGSVLVASNITPDDSSTNFGRDKVLSVESCEIRNSNDVWDIVGYELTDIKDVLCWFITGSESSMAFQSNRHLEINSCEIFNWYNEAVTPSIYSSGSNIEFKENASGSAGSVGFAVVNMAGNIIHPVQNQDGLFINTGSTTRFGTIAGNTFIDVGQNTTSDLFAGSTYNSASALNYDIAVNEGIANSTVYAMAYFTGSSAQTPGATFGLVDVTTAGGTWVDENSQRMTINSDGEVTYNGSKPIYASMLVTLAYLTPGGGGSKDYDFAIFRSGSSTGNNELSGSLQGASHGATETHTNTIIFSTTIAPGDKFGLYVQSPNDDITWTTIQFSIKE